MALPTTDPFLAQYGGQGQAAMTWPAQSAVAVTNSDSVAFAAGPCRALYIGVTGDVAVDMADTGAAVVFKAVPVGWLPIRVLRVRATGTTATNILALY